MSIRTRLVLCASAALACSSFVALPFAVGASAVTTVTNCVGFVEGVDPTDTIQFANLYTDPNPTFYRETQPLGFTPAFLATGDTQTVTDDEITTTAHRWANGVDGTLRLITDTTSEYDGTEFHSRTIDTIPLGYRLAPRLFTFGSNGAGPAEPEYMYRVSTSGYLYRDTYHAATSSRPASFGGTVRLGRDLLNARTLTAHDRVTLDGQRVDVLFGTTTYGRLFETTVPLAHPSRIRSTVLARSGFDSFDYLGAEPSGGCNEPNRGYDHVLVGVDTTAHVMREFALRTVHHPTAADLAYGPTFQIGPDLTAVH